MAALGNNRYAEKDEQADEPSRYYTLGELNALQNFEELYYSTGPAANVDEQSAPLLRRLESGRFREDQIGAVLRQSQPEHPPGLLSHRSGEVNVTLSSRYAPQ